METLPSESNAEPCIIGNSDLAEILERHAVTIENKFDGWASTQSVWAARVSLEVKRCTDRIDRLLEAQAAQLGKCPDAYGGARLCRHIGGNKPLDMHHTGSNISRGEMPLNSFLARASPPVFNHAGDSRTNSVDSLPPSAEFGKENSCRSGGEGEIDSGLQEKASTCGSDAGGYAVEAARSDDAGDVVQHHSSGPSSLNSRVEHSRSHRGLESWSSMRKTKKYKKRLQRATSNMEAAGREPFLRTLVTARLFEIATCVLVVVYGVFIGVQVQLLSLNALEGEGRQIGMFVAEAIFVALFTAELALRLAGLGWDFFRPPDHSWNVFDFAVVAITLLQFGVETAALIQHGFGLDTSSPSEVSSKLIRVMRLTRVARILRLVRLLRAFRELRMMLYSVWSAMLSLVWSMIILFTCFYLFGICLTEGAVYYLRSEDSPQAPDLVARFGTLDASVLSLFEAMSGGVDWGDLLDALGPLSLFYRVVFVVYISFSIFAVTNIVTGVFVEHAVQASSVEQENMIQSQEIQRETFLTAMINLFHEVDADHSGSITETELVDYLKDERALTYLEAMQLHVDEVETLFRLLDANCSGSVEIDEFVHGIHKLSGKARALDTHILQLQVEYILHQVMALQSDVSKLLAARRPREPVQIEIAL